ncbi:DUF4221 domain-containing protein [Algoriphagus sp. AGSA1]|uniref:DUF4221 family protein n=1 Tax=Algoriphagus sp. AGSA1 TaxID=2907213 RepID=UPI001F441D11|nr:DUF4221 family protein [Algoriphagus sp. AGSA1]MCE7055929.1 DUF4221 domain-containing protein [Algoriphagus sp. AGSA1]
MKKLIPLILLTLLSLPMLFSCGSGSSDTEGKSDFTFSFTMDTIQVDPGDHLVFISNYMSSAAVGPDKKILYNLNTKAPELEIIDLETMTYQESIPLEKEGPAGIGTYVSDLAVSEKGDFIFQGYQSFVKANSDLDHYELFKFQAENLKGDSLAEKEGVDFGSISSRDGNYLFATYSAQEFGGATKGLAIVDLKTMELRKIPIAELESLVDFNINQFADGNPRMSTIERVWILEENGKIYLTNTARNEAFIFDLKSDSLEKKSFHSTLTSDSKKGLYTKHTNSDKEMNDAWTEKNKEVNFNNLVYDHTNKKFWRVSTEMDRMIADSVVTKEVLTIFDQDLNQLHEEKIEFNISQSLAFFKEGTLYSFINLEDELGFVRIKPSYE